MGAANHLHTCISSLSYCFVICVWIRFAFCAWVCVCVCVSLCVCQSPCTPIPVSLWVDVIKWGHFLSVWCLRNNPTAQKLLQQSASTYLSLYLYCSGYAWSVLQVSYSHCLVTACNNTLSYGMLALLLTIWGFDTVWASMHNWRKLHFVSFLCY